MLEQFGTQEPETSLVVRRRETEEHGKNRTTFDEVDGARDGRMPGVSSRRPVAGADGLGKVYLRFKPKPPPRGHRVLGFFVYGTLFFCIALSFCWSRVSIRYSYVVPAMRKIVSVMDAFVGGESETGVELEGSDVTIAAGETVDLALFRQGYAHAKDRYLQMDTYRRTVFGTLSEYHGNSTVETDKFYRTLNIAGAALRDQAALSKEDIANLQSYANGVNSYITEVKELGLLPLDVRLLGVDVTTIEPWTPQDSLAILRLMMYTWSSGWENQLLRILIAKSVNITDSDFWFRNHVSGDPVAFPSVGGTVIAVSKEKSVTGTALLASSLTSLASNQGLWYFNALRVPGKMNVLGASIPGVPYVFAGRNRYIAWAFSQSGEPTEELFIPAASFSSQIKESTSSSSATANGELTDKRVEVLRVRGSEDVEFEVRDAIFGPIISERLSATVQGNLALAGWEHIAIASSALSENLSIEFLRRINTARDLKTAANAAEMVRAASLRFAFVTQDGQAGYATSGSQRKRWRGTAGWTPLLGAPNQHDIEDTPISTTGKLADGVMLAVDSEDTAFRLKKVLHMSNDIPRKISTVDLKMALIDTHSASAIALKEIIMQIPDNHAQNGWDLTEKDLNFAKSLVANFDGHLSLESEAAVLIEAFRVTLLQRLFHPLASLSNFVSGSAISSGGSRVTPQLARTQIKWFKRNLLENCTSEADDQCTSVDGWKRKLRNVNSLVAGALQEAVDWCTATYGTNIANWHWGTAHIMHIAHTNPKYFAFLDEVLTVGPASIGGGGDTLLRADVGSFAGLLSPSALGHYEGMPSSSYRMVVDMGVNCLWGMIPTGQSNRLSSKRQGGTGKIARWTSPDTVVAYDNMCMGSDSESSHSGSDSRNDEL